MNVEAVTELNGSGGAGRPVSSIAQYIGKDRFAELTRLPAGLPAADSREFRNLPLVLTEPAVVRVGNGAYAMDQEGLYRFFDLDARDMRQAYLYRGDIWLLAGNLSQLHVHGWRHRDGLSMAEKEERVRRGRISMTCGPTAAFIAAQLGKLEIRGRVMHTLTLDAWNEHDYGHTLMELFDPAEGRWLFYDSDIGCRLKHHGRWLDLGEACLLYRHGETPELEFPAGRCMMDPYADKDLPEKEPLCSLLFDAAFRSNAALHVWYRRTLQVPVADGVFPSDVASETARAHSYAGGRYCRERLSWADWRMRLYGKKEA